MSKPDPQRYEIICYVGHVLTANAFRAKLADVQPCVDAIAAAHLNADEIFVRQWIRRPARRCDYTGRVMAGGSTFRILHQFTRRKGGAHA